MKQALTLLAVALISALTAATLLQTEPAAVAPDLNEPDTGPGSKQFLDHCSACHQPDGRGTEDGPPPLQGSAWVRESETRMIKIVLHGLGGRIEVAGKIYNLEMPSFHAVLTDKDIAEVLSFVRRNWGDGAAPVSPETVRRVRDATRDHVSYMTVEELLSEP